MSSSSLKKKKSPSNSAPANASGLASQSQASQQLQVPIKSQSQSHSQSPQQSQPLYLWSTHSPLFGQSPSPFPRYCHALSTTTTAAGELFLFGGRTSGRTRNDLYMISTRDFSMALVKTSGDVPSPRYGHRAVLTSTNTLLIWGGRTDLSKQTAQKQRNDDSFYLLNLGASDIFHLKTHSS
jgi:hypothetical protein